MHNEATVPPGLRVLLAEDEPLIALYAEDTLRALGVEEVIWVRTVADGIAALDAGRFDAALLDLRLGAELSLPLAQRLAFLNVPFGFLTGFQDRAIPDEFKGRPLAAKPFRSEEIHSLLRALLARG